MAPTNTTTWRNLLVQKKNIIEIFTREFFTIDHRQMTLHALQIEIMDQLGVKPQINVAVKIEENMSGWITLCWQHIVTVIFPNYKCILNKHTKKHTLS
jgi:hypothetical protein